MAEKSVTLNMRLPESMVEQAESLIEFLETEKNFRELIAFGGTPSKSSVLKLAMQKGLDQLETLRGKTQK